MLKPGLALAALVAILDQLTKWAIFAGVFGFAFVGPAPETLPRAPAVALTGFLHLVTVWNYGVSFGIGNTGSAAAALALSALAAAIVAGLVVWLRRAERRIVAAALGLVIGGAVGNVVDRLRFGAVFDFLDFHVWGWHWPAFNLADSAITVGVGLLLLDALFAPRPGSK
jgi:signal peptidase II